MRAEAKASWRSVLLLAVLTLPSWSIQTERRETEAIPKNQVKGESEQDDTLLQACSQLTFLLCKIACMHQSIFGFVERIATGWTCKCSFVVGCVQVLFPRPGTHLFPGRPWVAAFFTNVKDDRANLIFGFLGVPEERLLRANVAVDGRQIVRIMFPGLEEHNAMVTKNPLT